MPNPTCPRCGRTDFEDPKSKYNLCPRCYRDTGCRDKSPKALARTIRKADLEAKPTRPEVRREPQLILSTSKPTGPAALRPQSYWLDLFARVGGFDGAAQLEISTLPTAKFEEREYPFLLRCQFDRKPEGQPSIYKPRGAIARAVELLHDPGEIVSAYIDGTGRVEELKSKLEKNEWQPLLRDFHALLVMAFRTVATPGGRDDLWPVLCRLFAPQRHSVASKLKWKMPGIGTHEDAMQCIDLALYQEIQHWRATSLTPVSPLYYFKAAGAGESLLLLLAYREASKGFRLKQPHRGRPRGLEAAAQVAPWHALSGSAAFQMLEKLRPHASSREAALINERLTHVGEPLRWDDAKRKAWSRLLAKAREAGIEIPEAEPAGDLSGNALWHRHAVTVGTSTKVEEMDQLMKAGWARKRWVNLIRDEEDEG